MNPSPKIRGRLTIVALLLTAMTAQGSDRKPKAKRSDVEVREAVAAAPITIARKPGAVDGTAQMVLFGKVRKIASHAVSSWKVQDGSAVLIAVVQPATRTMPSRTILRRYELETVRSRDLGVLPFNTGSLIESAATASHPWYFALYGQDPSGAAVTVLGDQRAMPGVIPQGTSPAFSPDGLSLTVTRGGSRKSLPLSVLTGADLDRIYVPPAAAAPAPRYLQVFPDGTAEVQYVEGAMAQGTWTTDGEMIAVTSAGTQGHNAAAYALPLSSLTPAKGIPARQRFSVRLTQPLSSRTSHEGDTVSAVSITPVVVHGETLLPAGSTLQGKIVQANSVGWGFKHETASLTLQWTAATPAGTIAAIPLSARVFQVENAQEKTDAKGKIQGIRSTGTLGSSAENGVLSFAGVDPVAYVFASAASTAVLGFAESEILYPSATELILEVTQPLLTNTVYQPATGPIATTASASKSLQGEIRRLPFRTKTKGSNRDSDITNLVFIGSVDALQRAFTAAGWLPSEELYAASTFRTVKTLTGNQSYTQAPMSVLLLDERAPLLTLSKTTNTFNSRHHLRVFPTEARYDGQTLLTASSTQDIDIAFSPKQKTFIHVIDQHIDNERSKVVNDLIYTGCVDGLDMVERPWVPRDAYNSTGDQLLTDGEAAVLRINACNDPRTTPNTAAPLANRMERSTRDTALAIRNSLYRGNFIYSGIAGGIRLRSYMKSRAELPAESSAWRSTDATGAQYRRRRDSLLEEGPDEPVLRRKEPGEAAPTPEEQIQLAKIKEDHKWDPPRYEMALQSGYVHMRPSYLSAVGVLEVSSNPTANAYFLFLADDVNDGWAVGGSVTVNSWRHFSNEFSYFHEQTKYELGAVAAALPPDQNTYVDDSDLDTDRIGLVTRQFEYNLLLHPTRPESRIRPYAAVGPVLQLISLNGAPLKKPAGVYSIGLRNIGLIKAAFDFGNTPPLDGGGVFRVGFQYGAGVKFRMTPRLMLRADWRETWSKNPDIIADSYKDYDSSDLDDTYTTQVIRVGPEKKFIKDRFTLGVAFTF